MKSVNTVFALLCVLFVSFSSYSQTDTTLKMNNERLGKLVARNAKIIESSAGYWRFEYGGRVLIILTDETHNRMRIMTPIIEVKNIKKKELTILLEANFDKALDAKFAFFKDYLWSVFTHPLEELRDEQFLDAIKQVKTLADNYGKSYSSGDLVFQGNK